jgi:hypothetical protein
VRNYAAHADVVYVASYPGDSVGMVNALHEVGMKARLLLRNSQALRHLSPLSGDAGRPIEAF